MAFTLMDILTRADQVKAYMRLIELLNGKPHLKPRTPYATVTPNNTLAPRTPYKDPVRNKGEVPTHHWADRPPRVKIVNTEDGNEVECQYNPTELVRELEVAYNFITADGLGYSPVQYRNTGAQGIKIGFDLSAIGTDPDVMMTTLRFFESLCFPLKTTSAPPPILLVWPNFISMTCVVTKWKEQTSMFRTKDLKPILGRVELDLSEARATALYSEDIIDKGGQRA